MGKGTVSDELIDYFKMDTDLIPTQSAFYQRRVQILPTAFQYLFDEFSSSFPQTTHQFKNHCILARDGTHVVYTTNAEIIHDYNKPRMEDYKGYNHMHLNGFVDVIIKACYHWRWGIELTFRYLKHASGLLYFHSRKPVFLLQEIYASLTLYNFGVFLANQAAARYNSKKMDPDNKYRYSIDFSTALMTARKYLLRDPKEKPIDIIRLLCKFVHAVKEEFRQFARPLRGIGTIHFNYR